MVEDKRAFVGKFSAWLGWQPWFPAYAGMTLLVIAGYSIYYFLFGYFHVYPALAARSYEYGFKELSDFQSVHDDAKMLVIWQGFYPNLYFRFWQKTPLEDYELAQSESVEVGKSVFHQTFDNLYFSWPVRAEDLEKFLMENEIELVVFPEDYLNKNSDYALIGLVLVEEINYPDNKVAFKIYRYIGSTMQN